LIKRDLSFSLNGKTVELSVRPNSTLLDVLRRQLKLTSVKKGCGRGECGACTVLLDGRAVCSCLTLAPMVSGRNVVTVEGLGKEGDLHPLQKAFIRHAAVQCGFCTSGMLLSAKALLDELPNPTEDEVRAGISGNLCRCTGYAPIVAAILDAAKRMHAR
jgi:carbon-monoxide dehydrogenase small subunit